jgi:hypothetical protein
MTTRALLVDAAGRDRITRREPCPCRCHGPGYLFSCDNEGCNTRFATRSCTGTVSVDSIVPSTHTGWEVGDTAIVMVEECLKPPGYNTWGPARTGEPGWDFERRQAAYATARVAEVLPVVAADDFTATAPYIRIMRGGALCFRLEDLVMPAGYYESGPFTWEPGMVALRLTDVVVLDPPVVEMVCDCPRFRPDLCRQKPRDGYEPCRVPLSATEGQEVVLP